MADDGPPATAGPLALVFGQRWSLAIVAVLAAGPLRFGALKAAVPGISATLLTRRLEALSEAGVVERISLPPPASLNAYALTRWGAELTPIVGELQHWASVRNLPTACNRPSPPPAPEGAHP